MKELFGLHDKEGKEYKLIEKEGLCSRRSNCYESKRIGNLWIAEPVVMVPDVEEKSKFKVGNWVTEGLIKGKIIGSGFDEGVQYIKDVATGIEYTVNTKHVLHLTSEEIKTHLKSICKNKGYKKGTKIYCALFPERGVFELSGEFEYWDDYDRLIDKNTRKNNFIPVIFVKGKFAEIVTEKKKLPQTSKEWRVFLGEYEDFRLLPENGSGKARPYYKFLDGYEGY